MFLTAFIFVAYYIALLNDFGRFPVHHAKLDSNLLLKMYQRIKNDIKLTRSVYYYSFMHVFQKLIDRMNLYYS